MRYISQAEASGMEPGERLYSIDKNGDSISIVADIEENLNVEWDDGRPHDDTHGLRVELYGWYGGDWSLDKDLVLDPDESALGEARGCNAGGICFGYEDEGDWERYGDAYECLFDNVPNAEGVAVLDSVGEVYDLPDGIWHVILPEYAGL